MKTYSVHRGNVVSGISVVKDTKLGPVVYLGESGRGRRYKKVGLFRKNPAETVEGKVLEAHPVKITMNRGTEREFYFYTLAKPHAREEKRALVRINTQACYTRNSSGSWRTHKGTPEDLVVGYGAHGAAGRIGSWNDGLIIMSPGDVLRVKPEGGYKTTPYAVIYDGETVEVMGWDDYEALEASENPDDVEYV